MRRTALALAALLAAAGCSTSAPSSQATVVTLAPSSSPSASPSPSRPASAAVLVARLKAASLPIRHLIVYTAATDPNHMLGRPGGYSSKTGWQDPRAVKAAGGVGAGVDLGGSIEVYPTAAGARARARYLQRLSTAMPEFAAEYTYLDGTAVLRVSRNLTPAQAQAYRAAFTAAVGQ